jgi:hypothetical protein
MDTGDIGWDTFTLDTHGLHSWDVEQGCDCLGLALSSDKRFDLLLLLLADLIRIGFCKGHLECYLVVLLCSGV